MWSSRAAVRPVQQPRWACLAAAVTGDTALEHRGDGGRSFIPAGLFAPAFNDRTATRHMSAVKSCLLALREQQCGDRPPDVTEINDRDVAVEQLFGHIGLTGVDGFLSNGHRSLTIATW